MRLPDDLADKLRGKAVLTIPEAAELLHLSLPTMYEAARNGSLPVLTFGARAKRVPVGALLSILGFEDTPNAEGTGSPEPVPSAVTPTPVPLRRNESHGHDIAAL